MRHNFKGIRSTQKSESGQTIMSGQKVIVTTHLNRNKRESEVLFGPDYGFEIEGNNLADAWVREIISQPKTIDRIKGNLQFFYFNIFGQ